MFGLSNPCPHPNRYIDRKYDLANNKRWIKAEVLIKSNTVRHDEKNICEA